MRGLTIIVTTGEEARFHAALSIAAAHAALGGATCIYLHADAVRLAVPPHSAEDDARFAAAGLPTLAQAFEDVLALEVRMIACQTGLALAGITVAELDPRIETGGLVSMLRDAGQDQLVTV